MWSLGCTLYELYTGRMLFQGFRERDVLASVQRVVGPLPEDAFKDRCRPAPSSTPPSGASSPPSGASSPPSGASSPLAALPPGLAGLIGRLIEPDPRRRMTAEQGLRHECVRRAPDAIPRKELAQRCARAGPMPRVSDPDAAFEEEARMLLRAEAAVASAVAAQMDAFRLVYARTLDRAAAGQHTHAARVREEVETRRFCAAIRDCIRLVDSRTISSVAAEMRARAEGRWEPQPPARSGGGGQARGGGREPQARARWRARWRARPQALALRRIPTTLAVSHSLDLLRLGLCVCLMACGNKE